MNTEPKLMTKELITNHRDIAGYLPIGKQVDVTIDGRVCRPERMAFLALIADLLREKFPVRFCYLEIGVLFGGSLCSVSFHQRQAETEKYAGIDLFSGKDESTNRTRSIDLADRNIRYFGLGKGFALFKGRSEDRKVEKCALAYLRGTVHMLYIDGSHTKESALKDFERYSPAVVPGGVVIFDDYHDNAFPDLTEAIDNLDKEGWNDIGGLAPNVPTMYVIQKEGKNEGEK